MNPSEGDDLDDPFYGTLAAYDDALAGGTASAAGPDPSSADESERLRRAQSCLHKLERRWPRSAKLLSGQKAERLGRFRIVRELGRGGCGIVFLAFDPSLRRHVALKVPRPEVLVSPERRRHFLREARAAAGLDHPHVVAVYETGEIGPIAYIAQAYCEGPTLAAWLRQRSDPVPARTAALLTATLTRAVQHAHEHGILHRDLKPGNVLLSPRTARGDGSGSGSDLGFIPRLTDFGLAKVLEIETGPGLAARSSTASASDDEATLSGALVGTPRYMSPEQAEGQKEIGPAADVYALGVILYELLAGRPPFQGATDLATLRLIVSEEPPSLRRLRPDVPADLEAICLKCLEKEPRRRYGSAAELAADLRRFLRTEPTRARPVGRAARAWKWAKRRPTAAALVAVSLGALLALVGGTGWYLVELGKHNRQLERVNAALEQVNATLRETAERERDQRRLAEQRERLLRLNVYADQFKLAVRDWDKGHIEQTVERLDELRPRPGQEDQRGFEFHYLQGRCHLLRSVWRGHPAGVWGLAVSPTGRNVASIDNEQMVRLWDVGTGQPLNIWRGRWPSAHALQYARDGRTLLAIGVGPDGAKMHEVASGKLLAALGTAAFHPPVRLARDGKVVMRSDDNLVLWDPSSGKLTKFRHTIGEPALALAPNGRTAAVGNADGSIDLRDVRTGAVLLELQAHDDGVRALVFAPGGRLLASGSLDRTVRLWDLEGERTHLATLTGHATPVESLAFSPDGRTLASACNLGPKGGQVKFWDVSRPGAEALRATVDRHVGEVQALAFLPDSRLLAVACADRTVRLFDPNAMTTTQEAAGHAPKETWSLAFSPDGRTLASAGDDHQVRLWDRTTGRQRLLLEGHGSLVTVAAYAPDGQTLASASFDQTVKLWDAATGQLRRTLTGATDRLYSLALSPNGRLVAAGGRDRVVRVWEMSSGQELTALAGHATTVRAIAFAPDGRSLVTTDSNGVRLWDTSTWELLGRLEDTSEVSRLVFAPDGQTLATANVRGVVRLWDWETRRERAALRGDLQEVYALAFTPDGRTLASAGADPTVRLWQAATGDELLHLEGHKARVNALAFTPDGLTLASGDHTGALILWRTTSNGQSVSPHKPIVPTD